MIDFIRAHTFHGRKGKVENVFRYSVDYVLLDAEAAIKRPWAFGRNRAGLMSVQDSDHGGPPKEGRGPDWARDVFRMHAVPCRRLMLLTQPRLFGYVFNPVSFWLAYDGTALRGVIAEVSNTFGDRHSYLCAHPDRAEILPEDQITAAKIFHVSPFQPIAGRYAFRFDIRDDRIGIWIDLEHAGEDGESHGGVIATLVGPRTPLSLGAMIHSALRRPFGARRVMALIHWQAFKLWWKGASYRAQPAPPQTEVSGNAVPRKVS